MGFYLAASRSQAKRLSDYDYIRDLRRPELAWEYLRRNSNYRKDRRCAGADHAPGIRLCNGLLLIRARRRNPSAEAWGLYTFR